MLWLLVLLVLLAMLAMQEGGGPTDQVSQQVGADLQRRHAAGPAGALTHRSIIGGVDPHQPYVGGDTTSTQPADTSPSRRWKRPRAGVRGWGIPKESPGGIVSTVAGCVVGRGRMTVRMAVTVGD